MNGLQCKGGEEIKMFIIFPKGSKTVFWIEIYDCVWTLEPCSFGHSPILISILKRKNTREEDHCHDKA